MHDVDMFEPVTLGGHFTLANWIVMTLLTRSRAGKGGVHGQLNADYRAHQASAGLIASEATSL